MSPAPYRRAERIASEIYEVLAELLRFEIADPRLKDVQLTGAEMTDDLQTVKIFYYVNGSGNDIKKCEKGFLRAKGFMKRAISERVELRLIPDIKFCFDGSVESGEKMDEVLKKLREDGGMGE